MICYPFFFQKQLVINLKKNKNKNQRPCASLSQAFGQALIDLTKFSFIFYIYNFDFF
jgi:hypothetical protein